MQNKYVILKSPVKIGDYERVASYSGSLVKGEEQLLVTRDLKFFLTDGKGGYLEFKSINSGITFDEVTKKLNDLDNKLSKEINDLDSTTSDNIKNIKSLQDAVDALSLKFLGYVTTTDFNDLKAQVESNTTLAVHDNRKVIDKFSEGTDGLPLYGGAAVYNGYTLYKAAIVETDEELEDTKGKIVDFSDVFNTWYRFSHDTSNNQPANQSETQSWNYLNGIINNTVNSTTYIGFVSNNVYDIYTHEVTLKSSDPDGNRIGVVIAFAKDNNGIEHTLSAMRDMETGTNWFMVYDYCKSTQQILSYKQSITGDVKTGWDAIPNGSRIRIKRNKNLIEAYASPFNSTVIDENSKLTLDLNSDSKFDIFKNPCAYGYSCHSQNKSMFTDVLFYESNAFLGNDNNIIDIRTDDVWVKSNGKWSIDATKNILSVIGTDKVVFNEYTNKIFYIKDRDTVIHLYKEEINVNEFKEVKTLANHDNREVLDKFSVDENDNPLFDGKKIVADFDTSAIEAEIADLNNRSVIGKKLYYGTFKLSSQQTNNLSVNSIINFNTRYNGNIDIDNSMYKISLKPGTYKIDYNLLVHGNGQMDSCIIVLDLKTNISRTICPVNPRTTNSVGDVFSNLESSSSTLEVNNESVIYAVISGNVGVTAINYEFSSIVIEEIGRSIIIDPAEEAKKKDFEYGMFRLSSSPTTMAAGDLIKFNTMIYGNMTINPTTYEISLKATKKYRFSINVSGVFHNTVFALYNTTTGDVLQVLYGAVNDTDYNYLSTADFVYEPAVNCTVAVKCYAIYGSFSSIVANNTQIVIQEIAQPYYFNYYKDSIKATTIFEGAAGDKNSIFNLTDNINNYEKLIIHACCVINSVKREKASIVVNVKDMMIENSQSDFEFIISSFANNSYNYFIEVGFKSETTFKIGNLSCTGWSNPTIYKIEGIGYNYDNPYQGVITTVDEFTLTDTEIDSDIMSIWNEVSV